MALWMHYYSQLPQVLASHSYFIGLLLFAVSCLHLHFYLNFYHRVQQVFSFPKSYCRAAAAVGEFMKFANGYPARLGELILLNVTSVYPHWGKLGAPFWEAVEVYFASFCGNAVNIFRVDICLQRVATIGNKIGTIYSIRQFPLFLLVQKSVGDFKTFWILLSELNAEKAW